MSYNISGIGFVSEEIWFTSDTFFFDLRGEDSDFFYYPEEKNEFIIQEWNKFVRPRDIVYHLGNFSVGNKKETEKILSSLHGRINLIVGSEDSRSNILGLKNMLSSTNYRLEMTVDNHLITLNHYPQLRWNSDDMSNSWMIHGYTMHQSPPINGKLMLDVGFSGFNRPINFDEVQKIMISKNKFHENLRMKESFAL